MKRIYLITGFAIALVLAIGCTSLPPSGGSAGSKELSLAGPVWFLAGYQRESGFLPIEPGHGSTARVLFRTNGTFEATTGWSVFSGTWKEQGASSVKILPAVFKSNAPTAVAEQFEQDFIRALRNARTIRKGPATIRFLDHSGKPVLDFISSSPDR